MDDKKVLDILEKVKVGEATQEEKMLVLKELNLTIEELNKLLGDVIEAMKNEIIK